MKIVVIYSGGLDSTVLLHHLHKEGHQVHALSINYGQRHRRELKSASIIAQMLAVPHELADLSGVQHLLAGSSLTSPEIPVAEGHYTQASMKSTVVPNRNMLFLALATSYALSIDATAVAYAAHSGDHAIYPDCRREFADAMQTAIQLADWNTIELLRPFVDWNKAEIVHRGTQLNTPLEKTWSCYNGGQVHCGRCGTCIERREAFDICGIKDPTLYADDAPSLTELKANNWHIA
jgi:7-cyano-7-deazaguanine synthase